MKHNSGTALSGVRVALLMMFALLISFAGIAQDRSVSGRVTDATTGEGIPGATVLEKGTQNGVITDFDGNFRISPGENAILVFSFVGYANQEIEVGGQTTINVALAEDVQQLSEIVVVGYGTQEAKDVTGVVATVKTEDFNKGQIASAENLISGKVAGVTVTPSTEPGGGSKIRIRGVTSLNGGQEPLYVVDGVILDNSGYGGGRNALNFINPSDIESMTILKDASASAIYGARAAAGVVLITTKSGKKGTSQLSYDGSYAFSNPDMNFGFLDPATFRIAVSNEAPQILPILGDENTVWVNEAVQAVTSQNHNLSLSGGNDKTSYNISFNHMINNGVVKYSQNKITRASVKVSTKAFNDALEVTAQQRISFTEDNFSNNVTGTALSFDPTRPIYDEENTRWGGYWEWQRGLAPANPVSTLDQIDNLGETRRSFTALTLTYNLPQVEGLSFSIIGSADFRDGKSQFFRPTTHLAGLDSLGWMSVGANKAYTFNVEPYISYKTRFESLDSDFEIMGGYSYQEVGQESYGYMGNNLSTNVYGFYDASIIDPERLQPWGINPIENHLQALYGRLNWNWKDKYLLTANIRYDGSTRFGPENRYGVFPSVALGWRMLDEGFMQGATDVFTDLKIRAGWGMLGNQAIGDYRYEKFYFRSTNDAQYLFGGVPYQMIRPTGVDPNIKWESTTTINFGIDYGMYNNRLTGTIDFYNKTTSDLLAEVAVPAFTNVSDAVITNVAEMYNRGIELGFNGVLYDRPAFDWNLLLNLAWNQNRITKLNRGEEDGPGIPVGGISGDVGQTIKIWKVGEAYDAFYTYIRDINGVEKDGEFYQDVDGDGIINENDLQITGKPDPDLLIGLTSNMRYKDFTLNFTLRSNLGQEVYNNTASANGYYEQLFQGGIVNNIHESVIESGYNRRNLHSDFYIENANFLILDNITLAWSYTKVSWMDLRIYSTIQNLFTVSPYTGPNPEIGNGIDNNLYPRATNFIFGLNLTF